MHYSTIVLPLLAICGFSTAAMNTTQEFKIVSRVKPGQCETMNRFNGLRLTAYHSGAGSNDAVLTNGTGVNAFFNGTIPPATFPNGQAYYNLTFDLGNTFPYSISIAPSNTYVRWYGLTINAGNTPFFGAAWYANETGLQVSLSPGSAPGADGFGGWWACDWSRGVPQLFLKQAVYNSTIPANCAEITLGLEYV